MDTDSTCQLGNTADRQFHFLAGSHDQVAELIDNDDDVRHEPVSLFRIQLAADELRIVFLDVTAACLAEQVVTGIHFHTERIEGLYHLGHVGDDGVFSVRQLGQEVTFNRRIDGEFHFLRVDDDELQFAGVLLVEKGSHDGIQTDRLTLSGCSGYQHVRRFGQIHHKHFVGDGLSECYGQVESGFLELLAGQDGAHRNDARIGVRYFNTDGSLARYWGDDTDSEGRKAQGNVVFQVTDLGDADTFGRSDLIKRNGRTHTGLDRTDLDAETAEHLDDAVLVGILFLHVDGRLVVVVSVQQIQGREFVVFQIQTGIVRLCHVAGIGFILFAGFLVDLESRFTAGRNQICFFSGCDFHPHVAGLTFPDRSFVQTQFNFVGLWLWIVLVVIFLFFIYFSHFG